MELDTQPLEFLHNILQIPTNRHRLHGHLISLSHPGRVGFRFPRKGTQDPAGMQRGPDYSDSAFRHSLRHLQVFPHQLAEVPGVHGSDFLPIVLLPDLQQLDVGVLFQV